MNSGAALLETLVAATLGAMVATTGTALLRAQARIAEQTTHRSERNDAMRSALLTLSAELRALSSADIRAVGRDSVAARIVRGVAIVCGERDGWTLVRYRGLRLPDASKDSASQVGVENVGALISVSAAAGACLTQADEETLALTLTTKAGPGSMWLVFEAGAYHLSGNALRYRRNGESRQPITSEVIDVKESAFSTAPLSTPRALHVSLTDKRTAARTRMLIRLPNAR